MSKPLSLYSRELASWAGSQVDAYKVTATVLGIVVNTSNALESLKREPHFGNTAPSRCWRSWVLKDE